MRSATTFDNGPGDPTHYSNSLELRARFEGPQVLTPDLPGVQSVWIQGVGCGDAIATFNEYVVTTPVDIANDHV